MGTKTNQHNNIKDYERLLYNDKHKDLDSYFKWTIIRHPFTRFATGILNHALSGGEPPSYRRFMEFIRDNKDKFKDMKVLEPQVNFIKDYKGNIRMDYIGTYEELQESFNKVCDLIGVNRTEVPHENKGKRQNYEDYLTDEVKDFVRKYYSDDMQLYNQVTGKAVIQMEELKKARLEELLAKEADESMGLGEDELRELNELKAEKEAEALPEEAEEVEAPVDEAEEEAEESEEEAEEEPAEE